MPKLTTSAKALNISLWIAQILLASTLLFGGATKLFRPIEDVSTMWPWTGQIPIELVEFTGIIDLLGAVGLILPALFRIKPILTPAAAIGTIILMICASIFHISRGETSQIVPNIIFAFIGVFIAWGRLKNIPISEK